MFSLCCHIRFVVLIRASHLAVFVTWKLSFLFAFIIISSLRKVEEGRLGVHVFMRLNLNGKLTDKQLVQLTLTSSIYKT